nr:ABC transporter substrate-binding protein [Micromonospora sp. DSM 115978]
SGGAAYLAEVGVPVTGNTLEPAWSQFPNMFSYANRLVTGPSGTTWGEFAQSHGGSRAVVVGNRVSQSSTAVSAQVTASLTAMGIEIVGEVVDFTPGVTNLERLGAYIADNEVDVVTGALPAVNFVEIVDAARQAGAQIDVAMSPTGYDQ